MSIRTLMRKIYDLLRANDTGVVLLLCLSFLFGIGTLVREAAPGAYEHLFGDDLRFFLQSARPIDFWFWIIALCCVLLGLSLATCAIERLAGRLRTRSRDPRDYGTFLLHVGVGIALLAHLIDGLGGSATMARLDDRFRPVGDREVRVVEAEIQTTSKGTVSGQRIWLESRDIQGRMTLISSAPNDPARWNAGSEMLLLMRVDRIPTKAVLQVEGSTDTLAVAMQRLLPDGGMLVIEQLFGPPEFRVPVARVRVMGGIHAGMHLLGRGMSSPIPDVSLRDLVFSPAAIVNHRKAPGAPWLLAAVIVLSVGCVLIAARWLSLESRGLDPRLRTKGGARDESGRLTG